jgi:hypothetical protein
LDAAPGQQPELGASAGGRSVGPGRTVAWALVVMLFFGGILAAVLLLSITLLAHRDKEAKAKPKNAFAGWQPVGVFSGRGRMESPRFEVKSSVWRMNWSCQANETPAKKSFQVHVMDSLGKLVGTPISATGDDHQVTVMEDGPGTFFLVVQATNMRWELTVEHQP